MGERRNFRIRSAFFCALVFSDSERQADCSGAAEADEVPLEMLTEDLVLVPEVDVLTPAEDLPTEEDEQVIGAAHASFEVLAEGWRLEGEAKALSSSLKKSFSADQFTISLSKHLKQQNTITNLPS